MIQPTPPTRPTRFSTSAIKPIFKIAGAIFRVKIAYPSLSWKIHRAWLPTKINRLLGLTIVRINMLTKKKRRVIIKEDSVNVGQLVPYRTRLRGLLAKG